MEENDINKTARIMDLLYINNLKRALNYTLENLTSLDTLDIRNRIIIFIKLIEQTENELRK